MKTVIYSLLALVLIPSIFLAFMSLTSRMPKTGLVADRLRPCPDTPNCVSSESETPGHHVEPLLFKGRPDKAWAVLQQVVEQNGGTIRQQQGGYLWATYTSRVFRFIDDVEFRLDAAQAVIHVRSASRAGSSDFGVNRKRVEKLRGVFAVALRER